MMFKDRLIATDSGEIFRCPVYDNGFCYASLEVETTNDKCGECHEPLECEYRKQLAKEQCSR